MFRLLRKYFSKIGLTGWRSCRGFSLPELLVTMGVGGVVFLAVASLSLYTGRSFAIIGNYVDLDKTSRNALDILTHDIRQVNFLDSYSTNSLTFEDSDGQPLTFRYDPVARTLTRIKSGNVQVLLTECDELTFRIYQRNPIPGTYDLVPTTNAVLCKAVDISWVCSRKLFGGRLTTESVQTARVVIRKQQD